MLATPSRHVLVLGTAWANARKQHAARMIGSMLAERGFGLVCGDSSGIDRWVADSYSTALLRMQQPLAGHFTQLAMGAARFWRRGGLPWGNHRAATGCRVRIASVEGWKSEAVARCHAAVMVGGGRGALDIAQRCIAHGKPVFPLPFHGGLTGNSDQVFQEILRGWGDHPVPGLSRGQFLRLAEPWVVGTGPLGTLLRGTLAEVPEVFVSYRRNDASSAAGRLAAGLQEHLGHRRRACRQQCFQFAIPTIPSGATTSDQTCPHKHQIQVSKLWGLPIFDACLTRPRRQSPIDESKS